MAWSKSSLRRINSDPLFDTSLQGNGCKEQGLPRVPGERGWKGAGSAVELPSVTTAICLWPDQRWEKVFKEQAGLREEELAVRKREAALHSSALLLCAAHATAVTSAPVLMGLIHRFWVFSNCKIGFNKWEPLCVHTIGCKGEVFLIPPQMSDIVEIKWGY